MVLFESMQTVSIVTAVVVVLLIWAGARKQPVAVAIEFMKRVFTSGKYFWHLIALIAILMVNKIELSIEQNMNYKMDFTSFIYSLEGNFVHNLQNLFSNGVITTITVFFYVVVFQGLMIASIAIYTYQKNYKLYYATCYAIIVNYIIAIPFYLFFPVNEVWSYGPANVQFLMLDAFPTFEAEYRPLSGLNNCFPSLHTSLSVTLMMLALHSGNKVWKVIASISAVIIIFGIFYLGIHWLTDMLGGLVLGLAASWAGIRLSEGRAIASKLPYTQPAVNRNVGSE